MAETNRTIAETNRAIAENARTVSQVLNMVLSLHESVKSLAATVAAHDDSMDELRQIVADTQREWQAYITRLPKS